MTTKRRKDIPTVTCRGCGRQMQGTEVTSLGYDWPTPKPDEAVINWTCANRLCPFGPKIIPAGQHLEDEA